MRKLTILLGALAMLVSCDKWDDSPGSSGVEDGPTKKFTFTIKGSFTSDLKTKASEYLYADGKQMTDLWVLDYKDGTLVQQLHQSNTEDDFGAPVMNLSYGTHHVYFVASRGQEPALNTTAKTITWTKVLDTFYKDYEVTVVATSNGNRAVTLERAVTRLRLTFTDAIAENAATISITPHTWYYGIDYTTGEPAEAKTDHAATITIPSNRVGVVGETANLYGISSATEWTTDVAIASKTGENATIGAATIEAAPFKRNRSTDYSGPLFSSSGNLSLALNSSWSEPPLTGEW